MDVPDLRTNPPPRWNVAIEGIVWLPRFAAKVRAYDAGTLGTYLLGQSPVDDEFLQSARLGYRSFAEIVRESPDDHAVLAEIETRSPGATDRLRLWSIEMPVRRRLHMRVLDLDDGYDRPDWMRVPHRIANAIFGLFAALLRKWRPLKI
jgi:hypothetical protein